MIAEAAQSIMQKYNGNAVLRGVLTGGLYFQRHPQTSSKPYGVFYIKGITREEIMGGADDFIGFIDVQFSLFSDDDTGGDKIAGMVAALQSCYNWQELSLSGYRYVALREVSVGSVNYIDEIWQVDLFYELWTQKE